MKRYKTVTAKTARTIFIYERTAPAPLNLLSFSSDLLDQTIPSIPNIIFPRIGIKGVVIIPTIAKIKEAAIGSL
jgi:hypothetical protein